MPPRRLCWAKGAKGQTEFHLGDVSKVEEVVDLGRRGQEALYHGVVHIQGGLGHHIPNGLHLFLKVLELLIDHGAEYPDDLGLLETGSQTQRCRLMTFQPRRGTRVRGEKHLSWGQNLRGAQKTLRNQGNNALV